MTQIIIKIKGQGGEQGYLLDLNKGALEQLSRLLTGRAPIENSNLLEPEILLTLFSVVPLINGIKQLAKLLEKSTGEIVPYILHCGTLYSALKKADRKETIAILTEIRAMISGPEQKNQLSAILKVACAAHFNRENPLCFVETAMELANQPDWSTHKQVLETSLLYRPEILKGWLQEQLRSKDLGDRYALFRQIFSGIPSEQVTNHFLDPSTGILSEMLTQAPQQFASTIVTCLTVFKVDLMQLTSLIDNLFRTHADTLSPEAVCAIFDGINVAAQDSTEEQIAPVFLAAINYLIKKLSDKKQITMMQQWHTSPVLHDVLAKNPSSALWSAIRFFPEQFESFVSLAENLAEKSGFAKDSVVVVDLISVYLTTNLTWVEKYIPTSGSAAESVGPDTSEWETRLAKDWTRLINIFHNCNNQSRLRALGNMVRSFGGELVKKLRETNHTHQIVNAFVKILRYTEPALDDRLPTYTESVTQDMLHAWFEEKKRAKKVSEIVITAQHLARLFPQHKDYVRDTTLSLCRDLLATLLTNSTNNTGIDLILTRLKQAFEEDAVQGCIEDACVQSLLVGLMTDSTPDRDIELYINCIAQHVELSSDEFLKKLKAAHPGHFVFMIAMLCRSPSQKHFSEKFIMALNENDFVCAGLDYNQYVSENTQEFLCCVSKLRYSNQAEQKSGSSGCLSSNPYTIMPYKKGEGSLSDKRAQPAAGPS